MKVLRLVPIVVLALAGVLVNAGSASADNAVTHETGSYTAACSDHVHPAVNVTGRYNLIAGVGQGGSGSWVVGTWTFTAASGHRMGFFVLYQVTDQGHRELGEASLRITWSARTGTSSTVRPTFHRAATSPAVRQEPSSTSALSSAISADSAALCR